MTGGGIYPESSAGTFDFRALEHPLLPVLCEGPMSTPVDAPPSPCRPSPGLPRHRFPPLSQTGIDFCTSASPLVTTWGRYPLMAQEHISAPSCSQTTTATASPLVEPKRSHLSSLEPST